VLFRSGYAFQRVAESVTEIEQGALASFLFVSGDVLVASSARGGNKAAWWPGIFNTP